MTGGSMPCVQIWTPGHWKNKKKKNGSVCCADEQQYGGQHFRLAFGLAWLLALALAWIGLVFFGVWGNKLAIEQSDGSFFCVAWSKDHLVCQVS